MSRSIRVGVDVGGTFTDAALVTDGGVLTTAKVPTTRDQSVGVMRAISKACRLADITPSAIDQFTHSMTVSVNALLEETGARTALVTTGGFRDVLEIGRQNRPSLYDLNADKPVPLVPQQRRLELDERATLEGITKHVDEDEIDALIEQLESLDVESVAVCLLHAYAHPQNEQRVAEQLRASLDAHISVSHEVLAEFREFERTSTTVIDAYLRPEIDRYLSRLEERSREARVPVPRVMQANGGTAHLANVRRRAVTTVMSGPAAGVVGARDTVERSGDSLRSSSPASRGLITFDMGGTSSDVSLIRKGEIVRTTNSVINSRPIRIPMIDVNTIGAGGGSIARVDDGGALRVGPRSAGARPGPACYGNGGTEPTVTDANLLLGYIGGRSQLGGEIELDIEAAEKTIRRLAEEAQLENATAAARGIFAVANAAMTRAIRSVTVQRGYDPRGYALAAFGGAGPMHAAALAEALDLREIIIPRACGVLSAFGLLAAEERCDEVRTVRSRLCEADRETLERLLDDLGRSARTNVSDERRAVLTYQSDLRYVGQSFELAVPIERPVNTQRLAERFHRQHERKHGYRLEDPVELVNLRAAAALPADPPSMRFAGGDGRALGTRRAYFGDGFVDTSLYAWGDLFQDQSIPGPAIVEHTESTVVIPPDWTLHVLPDGSLLIKR